MLMLGRDSFYRICGNELFSSDFMVRYVKREREDEQSEMEENAAENAVIRRAKLELLVDITHWFCMLCVVCVCMSILPSAFARVLKWNDLRFLLMLSALT